MRNLAFALLAIALLASCSKDKSGLPTPTQVAALQSSTLLTNASNQSAVTKLDTNRYAVNFLVKGQTVKTSVSGNVLNLTYTENIKLLLNPADYYGSWAVHLSDDFSQSALDGFDYTTVTKEGDVTFRWIDDNLNNITQKVAADTVVNNVKMVSLRVYSTFNFSKTYASANAAISAQNTLLAKTDDKIIYSSYYLMPAGSTIPYKSTDKITYIK